MKQQRKHWEKKRLTKEGKELLGCRNRKTRQNK